MAELMASNETKGKKRGTRGHKKSTRVDLTPMVDLGFLLITFFIFTTTMGANQVMDLNMPANSNDKTPVQNKGALTILLGDNNRMLYYEGKLEEGGTNIHPSSFKDIRNVLIAKKKAVAAEDLFVIIKPTDDSSYQNVVAILDEISINVITRYAIDEVTTNENILVAAKDKNPIPSLN
ncbi:ExbD/TolR family protein [Parasediminibacterium sp. JCM 36343]|uniref:ExbD/TolR family protein n=1 Tax=Parasediminibacterium sp. JCM 36343 TaxID=3374279 RepID=UPI003978FA42